MEEQKELMTTENRIDHFDLQEKPAHYIIGGGSPAIAQLNHMIRKVASSQVPVLLLGELGTGKTLIAKLIHDLSGYAKGPFVKVDCTALSDNLIESELFGFEKGAFTGALKRKQGSLEKANEGTIYLDEISQIPIGVQARLFRFLQDKLKTVYMNCL